MNEPKSMGEYLALPEAEKMRLAALPPVRSEPLLAIEDVLDAMSRIISEHPAAMEYETDARDTWPTRWSALLGYLKAKRDIANARNQGLAPQGERHD